MGRRRPRKVQNRAYYIRRKSLREGDSSVFFCDTDGNRIRFDKPSHCAFIQSSFADEQQAEIVVLAMLDSDRPYVDWLPEVLPKTVRPEAYLAAVEKTVQDRRAGRDVSRRQLKALERFMNRRT